MAAHARLKNVRRKGSAIISWAGSIGLRHYVTNELYILGNFRKATFEPRHDKTNKMSVRPAKTQISLVIRPVWSESSLSAWRNLGSLATHWAHREDSDQTGRTLILLVLSCRGSFVFLHSFQKCSLVSFYENKLLPNICYWQSSVTSKFTEYLLLADICQQPLRTKN